MISRINIQYKRDFWKKKLTKKMISHMIFKTSLLFSILNGISGREMNEIGSSMEQKSVGEPKNVRDESNIIQMFKCIFVIMTSSLIFQRFFLYSQLWLSQMSKLKWFLLSNLLNIQLQKIFLCTYTTRTSIFTYFNGVKLP